MKKYFWRTKEGSKRLMAEMSPKEIQEAFEIAEKTHVESENAIQRSLKRSAIFLEKIHQLRETASHKGVELQSLSQKHPGKYKILENTYMLNQ